MSATTQPDNTKVAIRAGLFALLMLGMAFAAVPAYRIFCQVTGFGGTTQVSVQAPGAVAGEIGVRFDANITSLNWAFEPAQTVRIAPGERTIVNYTSQNLGSTPSKGTATFNVTPVQAGQYFSKIECFCFTEQELQPGEKVEMPVIFFVDPEILTDPNTDHIDEITLSYTFFPVEN